LETLGVCRRGYFVEGLGGAQFALPGAVERLRELRQKEGEEPEPLVLAAADPAQPYGAALPWPKRAGARAARVAGAHVVLLGGDATVDPGPFDLLIRERNRLGHAVLLPGRDARIRELDRRHRLAPLPQSDHHLRQVLVRDQSVREQRRRLVDRLRDDKRLVL